MASRSKEAIGSESKASGNMVAVAHWASRPRWRNIPEHHGTSAILRGMWVSEVLLGDKIPNPPKGVPTLPEEAPEGLSERQLIERHSSDVRCAELPQTNRPLTVSRSKASMRSVERGRPTRRP